MICVYPADCTDFSTNGNGTLAPLSAEVCIPSMMRENGSGWWRAASSALLFPPP